MCIASLVLGICSLFVPYVGVPTAIVGLILGILGRKKALDAGAPTGMATAGIVMSIIALAWAVLVIIWCTACIGTLAYTDPYYWDFGW